MSMRSPVPSRGRVSPIVRAIVTPTAESPRQLRSPTMVGRDPSRADLVVDDSLVSGLHAVLAAADDGSDHWLVRDLGSRHGTYLDGIRVYDTAPLTGRHELSFGRVHVPFVLAVPAHLIASPSGGGRIVRGNVAVELDADELAFMHALARERSAESELSSRRFMRTTEVVAIVAPTAPFATDGVRALARRLERRLRVLGDPLVLESCERRGFRLGDCIH
jgi:FHA domain